MISRAAPDNLSRGSSERFCSKIRFGERRNTLCTRKGYAASVSQLRWQRLRYTRRGYAASVSQLRWQRLRYISSFTNCKIGAKDPLVSADAIVRCCLRKTRKSQDGRVCRFRSLPIAFSRSQTEPQK